jgi:hypothetical protein
LIIGWKNLKVGDYVILNSNDNIYKCDGIYYYINESVYNIWSWVIGNVEKGLLYWNTTKMDMSFSYNCEKWEIESINWNLITVRMNVTSIIVHKKIVHKQE